ncbi:hypothetical protein HOY80DRAFT_1108625 [Tuber brumale]|nr:hypothetical protein HOY80DRAFT_1108625 [Tuber brumale]
MSQDLTQTQFGDFPAGYFTDLLENDMSTIFGDLPPVSVDPLSDSIDPVLLQPGIYDQPFELSNLDSIADGAPAHSCTQALNSTPYRSEDTFGSLDASGCEGPAAVCTGIPPRAQDELSYPPVFDLEEYFASLDQPQLPLCAPAEASVFDHNEPPQDVSSLFGSSPPACQEAGQDDQFPTGFENPSLILPANTPLGPNDEVPIVAAVISSPSKASLGEGLALGDNGGPSNLTDLPRNHEIATSIPKILAPRPRVKITGKVSAMQKIKDAHKEVPIVYSVYEPLKPWSGFKYTTRGYLREDIFFDKESMQRFVRNHPNGERLNLRIEKHPYSFQCRYREPEYIKCRSKVCDWDWTFKVGDHRVAIDEVTGRLAEGQQDDNDPYFSAGYLHLHCFEQLIPVTPLVILNILTIDNRRIYEKEPDCTRINKMGVSPASTSAFTNWRIEAVEGYTVSRDWVPENTLAYALWLSGVRKGRKRVRAPPGITSDDIAQKVTTRRGWGGKRCSGVTVATMRIMESQGRSHEMVASRNGKTGKKGVRSPSQVKKRARSYSTASQTTQCTEGSVSGYEDAKVALTSPPTKKIKRTACEFEIAEDPVAPVTPNLPTDFSQIQDIGQLIDPATVPSQAPVYSDPEKIHEIGQLMATPILQTQTTPAPLQDNTCGNQYPNIDPDLGHLEPLDSIDWSKVPLAGDEDWNKENIDPALLQLSWELPPQQTTAQFTPQADNAQALYQQGWTPLHIQPRQYYQPPPPTMPASETTRRSTHRPSPITIPPPIPISISTPITVPAPTPQPTAGVPNLASRSLSPIPWTAPTTTMHRGRQGHRGPRPLPAPTYIADQCLQQHQQQEQNGAFFPTPTFPPTSVQVPHIPATQARLVIQGFGTAQAYPPQKTPIEPVIELTDINPFGAGSAMLQPEYEEPNLDALLTAGQMNYIDNWFVGQGL